MVGASILRYDVFGDTVNVAARMEASGEPMRIHVSESTAELLQNTNFIVERRGKVEVKVSWSSATISLPYTLKFSRWIHFAYFASQSAFVKVITLKVY